MRISNAERTEVTDLLSKHYAEGRLDSTEFDERVERAMRAKTSGDLAGLLDDLPGLGGPPPPPPRRHRPVLYWLLVAVLIVLAAGLLAAPPHVPVLLVVLVVWLLWHRGNRHRWHDRRALGSQHW
jgi:hypothetical protein